MSRAPRPKSVKPSTNRKTAGAPLFDPAVFLATAAVGRDISKYSKKEVIFAQGDDADAVFYIKKGKVKVAVISEARKGSHRRTAGGGRVCRRRMLDRTAEAFGDRVGNDGMRDDASGKDGNPAGHS